MKESDMVDSILGKVKGGSTPLDEIRKAQGKMEAHITELLKDFEAATGVKVRYMSVDRERTKRDKKDDCIGCATGAIKAITFDIDVSRG